MSAIERTQTIGGRSWLARLLSALLLTSVSALTACSTSYAVAPKLPTPAPELMEPEKTGSEYSQRVSRNMTIWAEMLDAWLTK